MGKQCKIFGIVLCMVVVMATSAMASDPSSEQAMRHAGSFEGQGYANGVEKDGFILKYDTPPEFIHHTAPEPGDVAHWYVNQRPSAEFPYEYKESIKPKPVL